MGDFLSIKLLLISNVINYYYQSLFCWIIQILLNQWLFQIEPQLFHLCWVEDNALIYSSLPSDAISWTPKCIPPVRSVPVYANHRPWLYKCKNILVHSILNYVYELLTVSIVSDCFAYQNVVNLRDFVMWLTISCWFHFICVLKIEFNTPCHWTGDKICYICNTFFTLWY